MVTRRDRLDRSTEHRSDLSLHSSGYEQEPDVGEVEGNLMLTDNTLTFMNLFIES